MLKRLAIGLATIGLLSTTAVAKTHDADSDTGNIVGPRGPITADETRPYLGPVLAQNDRNKKRYSQRYKKKYTNDSDDDDDDDDDTPAVRSKNPYNSSSNDDDDDDDMTNEERALEYYYSAPE